MLQKVQVKSISPGRECPSPTTAKIGCGGPLRPEYGPAPDAAQAAQCGSFRRTMQVKTRAKPMRLLAGFWQPCVMLDGGPRGFLYRLRATDLWQASSRQSWESKQKHSWILGLSLVTDKGSWEPTDGSQQIRWKRKRRLLFAHASIHGSLVLTCRIISNTP